ncbi:MAG: glycine betaine ABC transporter substrate-binding protein [Gemmatimonadota bacterium]
MKPVRSTLRVVMRAAVHLVVPALLMVAESHPAAALQDPGARSIIVASKPFGESFLLAEMFAQTLESNGFRVDRRMGLGATEIAFGALRSGAIDVYPEYTGTGLLAILKLPAISDPRETFRTVQREFKARYGIRWLPPLGFQNTYAIAVRRETAARYHLHTISDLAREAAHLTAGFTPDFTGRADGLPGLAKAYGLAPRGVRSLLQAVKYQALAGGSVDVIDGYSTDGQLARYNLVVLEDDKHFFPPYQAAALVGSRLQRSAPAAIEALSSLSGIIDEETMRRLNQRVEVNSEPVAAVARSGLEELGVLVTQSSHIVASRDSTGSFARFMWDSRSLVLSLTLRHLVLVSVSLLAAILLAVPLGLLLERSRGSAESVIRSVGLMQTIPSIALLAFMLPLLGIGMVPALVALFLYSLYPILRNTYTGIRDAAPAAVSAATALGMTPGQVLFQVRLPLAAPVIMAGIRTAAVINVGTATLAAFIGAGGLGDPIVAGLALSDTRMILSGALPAALLALLVDLILGLVERGVTPGGI